LYITGTDFDQPAAVGLLLLIGTVVNNGIVMLAHVNHYRDQGLARYDAMLRGCRERLRPVMMTALTTLVSLVPMAVQKPSLGGVYYYSMALVIMGGLLLSSVLTLILLPTATTLVEDSTSWLARLVGKLAVLLRLKRKREALAD
jgi:HAE1 family hydrophobic/amphiphilic exporter-1